MTNIFSKFFNKNNNFYDEASERKSRSEAILKEVNIPINEWLPVIETEVEAKLREPVEVARRAMALCLVSLKGGGEEQAAITVFLQKLNLEDHLSPDEHNFIYNDNPSAREKIQFSWMYECYWVMLWALGYIDNLGLPDHICDVPIAVKILINKTDKEFIDNIKFRTKKRNSRLC